MARKRKAKLPKLGSGGRSKKMKTALMKKGYSASYAGAVIGIAGRKKFGSTKMAKWSAAGRKRAAVRKKR